ncbi:lanthionine synthetase LanC family protein [Chryseobacterium kwangjuense]|uniref:Lanthionine synthetase n=1 Tax=Chryseobacterium kwangjuense TaxID=267125 RepID=A0A135WDS3_9FLAO|nr:lanthionine synthetase LanC family protein [Chryseobacterium kwangjuense]KXH83068.1 hypothetical protein AU378_11585 [Chryseobacterium kwangjuense]
MLSAQLIKDLDQKLHDIYIHLGNHYTQYNRIGALNGLAGIALFQFYYEESLDLSSDNGINTINFCIEKINEGQFSPSYCNGMAGFGWLLNHLEENGFVEKGEFASVLSVIDIHVENHLHQCILHGNYDFFHGALGAVFYFLKRSGNNRDYENSISLLFSKLPDLYTTINDYDLCKFAVSETVEGKSKKMLHLGAAHGIASLITILSLAYDKGYFRQQSLEWVNTFVRFLLESEMPPGSVSQFPMWTDLETKEKAFSSLSWCSGDTGIGAALLNASKLLGHSTWKDQSVGILKKASGRREIQQSMIKGYGICHGYFGASRIFSRAYAVNPSQEFKEASHYWLKKGINSLSITEESPLSILNGLAGAGLVMLDVQQKKHSSWDECLLIS